MTLEIWGFDIGPSNLLSLYTSNLAWSLFLTSTALHAIALITSPVTAVYKWYRRQSSDSDSCLPYVCALVGSSLWLRYSLFLEDFKLALLQMYAVFMQTCFLIAFVFYKSKKRRLVRGLAGIALLMFLLFYYIYELEWTDAKAVSGRFASGAQMAGSLICPYFIYMAVTTKVIDFIPLTPVVFTWIMEVHAIIYSVGINDFYMLIANTTFFLMDGLLLLMFFIYPTEKVEHKKIEV